MGEERSILRGIIPDNLCRCSALKEREHGCPFFKLLTADSDLLPKSPVWKCVGEDNSRMENHDKHYPSQVIKDTTESGKWSWSLIK